MSTSTLHDLELFLENLPHYEDPDVYHQTTNMFNHILISYFYKELEVHSTKFYLANLGESDIEAQFFTDLELDVEDAVTTVKLSNFFESVYDNTAAEPDPSAPIEYVLNVQPVLDMLPDIPGLHKNFIGVSEGEDYFEISYTLSDGYVVGGIAAPVEDVTQILAGTFDNTAPEFLEVFEDLRKHFEDLLDKNVVVARG